jgi:hypothetical protein
MEIINKTQIYGMIKLEARVDDDIVYLYESRELIRSEVFGGIKLFNQTIEVNGTKENFVSIQLNDDSISTMSLLKLLIDIIDKKLITNANVRIAIETAISEFQAFLQKRSAFNESKLKGLIGELKVLCQLLDLRKSVYGWIGAQGESVDFVYDDIQIEVKSVENISKPINISSLEQLAYDKINLLVNSLSACEMGEEGSFNLEDLGNVILSRLNSNDEKEYWNKQLNELGLIFDDLPPFVSGKYFKLNEQRVYNKSMELPTIDRDSNSLSERIIDVKYTIDLNDLPYKKSIDEVV